MQPKTHKTDKIRARLQAKFVRAGLSDRAAKSVELLRHFPAVNYRGSVMAGFWPIGDEIDLRPMLLALHRQGSQICLPITPRKGHPLSFKTWTPNTPMAKGRFGTIEPKNREGEGEDIVPNFLFVPLLGFTSDGDRLGYGGGYYDRTIAKLRSQSDVFTCGVGFDAQKMAQIPIGPHDIQLDALLTPSGFRKLTSS